MASERRLAPAGSDPVERIKQTIDSEALPGDRLRQSVPPGAFDQAAVGLVVGEEVADEVAGTVLRANRAGHHVLVALGEPVDVEALEFARQLGATIIDADLDIAEPDPVQSLYTAARQYGFPGLVYNRDPGTAIDIEGSVDRLRGTDRYSIEAVVDDAKQAGTGIVVGIPAYNEAVSIGSAVLDANHYADEVIVVDDGSADETATIAREAGATVIEHAENRGKGAAVKSLFEHVLDTEFEALVLLDGDGQHSPKDIPQVVEPLHEGAGELVIGSRYLDGRDHDTPRYRRLGQRVLDLLTAGSSRTRVSDSQSGFRALSPEAVERITLRSNGYGVETEMIEAATRSGLDVVETPIDVRYAGLDGSTQNPFRHGLAVVVFVVQLIRDRHPLLFFGVPGMVLAAAGLALGFQALYAYTSTGTFYGVRAMVSGFLVIVGSLGVFAGFMLNQIANIVALNGGETT